MGGTGSGRPGGVPPAQRGQLRHGKGLGRVPGSKGKITRARVEKELRFLAFSDPVQLFDRVAKSQRVFKLREIAAMPEEMRRCIASVKVRTENLTAGDDSQDTTVEVRLWDKTKALEMCARALGMLTDKHELTVSEGSIALLDAWKKRQRGEP